MNRAYIVLTASLVCGSAFAQSPAVPAAEHSPITNSRPQAAAEAKVSARPVGKSSLAAAGSTARTPEAGAIGTDKAAVAGQGRAQTRDARRPARDGGKKPRAVLGGTPN